MNLLRHLFVLIALLAQAWPAQAVLAGESKSACCMECCSGLTAAEAEACGCATPSSQPAPVRLPPAASREGLPQPVWVEAGPRLPVSTRFEEIQAPRFYHHETDSVHGLQTRLSVLFCSFLN